MVWQINLFLALNSYTHKLITCIFLHPSPRSVPLPFIKCSQLLGKQKECNIQVDLQGWGAQGWKWVSCRCSAWSRCPSQSHRSWLGKSDNDARIDYSTENISLSSHIMCGISTKHVGSKISTIIYQYHITFLQWVKLSKWLLHWLHSGLIGLSYLYSKLTLSARSQRMFSGFRSLCAIPEGGEELNKISHMFEVRSDHCLMIKEKFGVSFV